MTAHHMTITRRDGLILAGTAVAAASAAAFTAQATESPLQRTVTPELFNRWIAMRGGEDGPAYWYSDGLVRNMRGGAVESRMLGVETWITPQELRTPTKAVSISRKVYFFLEKDKDVIVTDAATGKPRRPSIFAYQVRTFELKNGAIIYGVESHDTRSTRKAADGTIYTVTSVGDQVHVNYAVFPAIAGADGSSIARGEVYDYFDHGPAIKEMPQRYQFTWSSGNTAGTMPNMMGWRFPTFDAVPNEWLKTHIKKNGPLWMVPPKDMAEIETLRKTLPVKTDLIPS
jgi:hypothetical protein